MTPNTFSEFISKSYLGRTDLKTYLLDAFQAQFEAVVRSYMGLEGFVYPGVTFAAAGAGYVTRVDAVSGTAILGADGQGNMFAETSPATDLQIEAFEAAAATNYDVGLNLALVPADVRYNRATSTPEFVATQHRVGVLADPDLVADDGDGTMTIRVDGVTEVGVTNAGRKIKVWLKTPQSGVMSIAMEELTVQWDGANNYVSTTAAFGQSVISVVAADYSACLIGPEVKRNTDLKVAADRAFVGTIVGDGAGGIASFDISDQRIYYSNLLANLNGIMRIDAHSDPKIRVTGDSGDVNEPQLEVMDPSGNSVFSVDEGGDEVLQPAPAGTTASPIITQRARIAGAPADVTRQTDTGGNSVQTVPNGADHQFVSAASDSRIVGDGAIKTNGVTTFEDTNTGAPIPLSSSIDAAIDSYLPQTLIGAINWDHLHAKAGKRELLAGWLISTSGGGGITDGGGLLAHNPALAAISIEGEVVSLPSGDTPLTDNTLNYVYFDAFARAMKSATTLNSLALGDILMAKVTTLAGAIASITDLLIGNRIGAAAHVYTVGADGFDRGYDFNTLAEALLFCNELMDPDVGTKLQNCVIEICADTAETTESVITANGIHIVGRKGAVLRYSGDHTGISINGANDVVLRDLILDHTANADDGAGLNRVAVRITATSRNLLVQNVSISRSGASAWHIGLYDEIGGGLVDAIIDGLHIAGASDYGIRLIGLGASGSALSNVVCSHASLAAGDFQSVGGVGLQASASSVKASGVSASGSWAGGIAISGSGGGRWTNIEITSVAGTGVSVTASNTAISNIRVSGVTTVGGVGIEVSGSDVSISNFSVDDVQADKVSIGASCSGARCNLTGGTISNTGGNGINWSNDSGSARGVSLYNIGTAAGAADPLSGLDVTGTAADNKFTDLDINVSAVPIAAYAISMAVGTTGNHTVGCTLHAMAVADASSSNTWHGANDYGYDGHLTTVAVPVDTVVGYDADPASTGFSWALLPFTRQIALLTGTTCGGTEYYIPIPHAAQPGYSPANRVGGAGPSLFASREEPMRIARVMVDGIALNTAAADEGFKAEIVERTASPDMIAVPAYVVKSNAPTWYLADGRTEKEVDIAGGALADGAPAGIPMDPTKQYFLRLTADEGAGATGADRLVMAMNVVYRAREFGSVLG